MRRFFFPLPALLITLLLGGCAAQQAYKAGLEREELGADYEAAESYLDALDLKEGEYPKAELALLRVAEVAYGEKLAVAENYERDESYALAMTEYQELQDFLSRLKRGGALSFVVIDVNDKIAQMQSSAAEQHYQAGEDAFEAKDWETALKNYNSAQDFLPDYKDTDLKMGTALYRWGEDELAAKRLRRAAQRFAKVATYAASEFPDANERAAKLYAGLGRHHLAGGSCRRAVTDLRDAQKLLANHSFATDLQAAEACAVTPVAVLPFENPTGRSIPGLSLENMLADAVGASVTKGASEFIRLVDRSLVQGLQLAPGVMPTTVPGVRYLVVGQLTQVGVEDTGPMSQTLSTGGTSPYSCTKTNNNGKTYETTCFHDVLVNYQENTRTAKVHLAGSLRVIDTRTGAQLVNVPIEGASEDSAHWTDGFTVGGQPVAVGLPGHKSGIGVPTGPYNLSKESSAVASPSELAGTVIARVGEAAGKAVLEAVDKDEDTHDPTIIE